MNMLLLGVIGIHSRTGTYLFTKETKMMQKYVKNVFAAYTTKIPNDFFVFNIE